MDSLIRRLSKYGAITIMHEGTYWHVGCVVNNPDYSENNYIEVTNDKLYFAFKDILKKADDEYKSLLLKPHIEQKNLLG